MNEYSLETLRNAVSIVPQKSQLFSGTVEENLRFGNEKATENEIVSACKIADAHDFVCAREGSYKAQTGQGGTNFSGGQRQRLCIARAIASNPKILILDDSLSAVDTNTDFRIRSALKNALPNTTKIVIAQRISSVQDADEILVLDDGKIVGKGVHQNLLETCDVYREVWNSQQENMGLTISIDATDDGNQYHDYDKYEIEDIENIKAVIDKNKDYNLSRTSGGRGTKYGYMYTFTLKIQEVE